jgi:hypothetical protein
MDSKRKVLLEVLVGVLESEIECVLFLLKISKSSFLSMVLLRYDVPEG